MGAASVVEFRKLDHTYALNGQAVRLCVSDVLRLAGICLPYPNIPWVLNAVEHARLLGETVHEWCEYLDQGGSDVDALSGSEPLPYVLAYQRFLVECQPEWEAVEESVVAPEIDCAGTPDRIGALLYQGEKIRAVVDIKTPQKPEKHWQIQLSGYQYIAKRPDHALLAVHLADDGTYKIRAYESEIETFLCAVKVAHWKLDHGKKL